MKTSKHGVDTIVKCRIVMKYKGTDYYEGRIIQQKSGHLIWNIIDVKKQIWDLSTASSRIFSDYHQCLKELRKYVREYQEDYNMEGCVVEICDDFPDHNVEFSIEKGGTE